MNDLVLSEDGQAIQADEYHDDEDWYETRPGSEISSPKNEGFRPIRGQKSKYLIILGIIVVAVGFFSLSGGKKEEDMAVPATPATSVEDGVFDYVSQFVDKKTLLEDDTYTNSAYNWLLKNSDIEIYGNSRIRQRFALASIYYATNEGLNSWDRDDGWITDQDECTWDGVRCENGNIIGLNLTSNGLTGVFPMEITMLKKHLLALEISDNELTNEDQQLRWIGKLTTLRLLDFEDTDFTADGIPTYIGELTDLRILEMANTNIAGKWHGGVFNKLQQLLYLDMGAIGLNRTMPDIITRLPKLEAFYGYDCGLKGELESFLPNFKAIEELWLDGNYLSGFVPTVLSSVSTLASLSLSENSLTGSLPTELGLMTNMEQLWLFGNELEGEIPSEIGSMSSLQILGLEDNNMKNISMPSEICDLGLVALSADCTDDVACSSDCCTCCTLPCPVATLHKKKGGGARRRALLGF